MRSQVEDRWQLLLTGPQTEVLPYLSKLLQSGVWVADDVQDLKTDVDPQFDPGAPLGRVLRHQKAHSECVYYSLYS